MAAAVHTLLIIFSVVVQSRTPSHQPVEQAVELDSGIGKKATASLSPARKLIRGGGKSKPLMEPPLLELLTTSHGAFAESAPAEAAMMEDRSEQQPKTRGLSEQPKVKGLVKKLPHTVTLLNSKLQVDTDAVSESTPVTPTDAESASLSVDRELDISNTSVHESLPLKQAASLTNHSVDDVTTAQTQTKEETAQHTAATAAVDMPTAHASKKTAVDEEPTSEHAIAAAAAASQPSPSPETAVERIPVEPSPASASASAATATRVIADDVVNTTKARNESSYNSTAPVVKSTKKACNAQEPNSCSVTAEIMVLAKQGDGFLQFKDNALDGFMMGSLVHIGEGALKETNHIAGISPTTISLKHPLQYSHIAGSAVSQVVNLDNSVVRSLKVQQPTGSSKTMANMLLQGDRNNVMTIMLILLAGTLMIGYLGSFVMNLASGQKGLNALPFASWFHSHTPSYRGIPSGGPRGGPMAHYEWGNADQRQRYFY